jgi:chitin disaccharide deacetylase
MANLLYLIVNADDFGQSPGINRGIIAAHERGIVTSTSLMVRWPAAAAAAAYARAHPRLAVGLHLDFGEWAYRDGVWAPLYEVVREDDAAAVVSEIARQLTTFSQLIGRHPTHLDSHQHAHLNEPARTVALEMAHKLGVPLRECSPKVRYCGNFYGQMADGTPLPEILSVEGLLQILRDLPPGVTELGCHPGEASDLITMYRDERAQEVRVLCDARVRDALPGLGIELRSFGDLLEQE